MRKFMFLAVPIVLLFAGAQAQASTIQVGSAGALGANDAIDWGTYGDGALLGSPTAFPGGLKNAVVSDTGGLFTSLVEGTDWFGNFTVGDNVLFTGDANDPFAASNAFTIDLTAAVAGLGLQITSNFYGAFTASLEVFNGATSLGVFNVAGVMDGNEDGTAPFLGALSDAVDINRAVFTLTSNTGAGLGVNRLLTTDTPFSGRQVPEPASMLLLGSGLIGAAIRRRRQQRQ